MKSINNYINERLTLNSFMINKRLSLYHHVDEKLTLNNQSFASTITDSNINTIDVQELKDLHNQPNKRILSRFLKGTEYDSSLKIYLKKLRKCFHIHRYDDMHQLDFTIVYNSSQSWPEEDEWKNRSIDYNELDDRMTMKMLFDDFYEFLENIINKKI